ncbi:MAG: Recombination endonuclease VII [Methanosaeta sp. PtaU1.Bin060]|nr:MAG: Recombination endonuclease VII [Methanosaeta sp. PtaU1.Bin060]
MAISKEERSKYNKKYYQEHKKQRQEAARKWYEENKDKLDKEKLKDYHKAYYEANRDKWPRRTREQQDKYNATRRERYANDPNLRKEISDKVKDYHKRYPMAKKSQRIKKKYGISLQEFNTLLESQGGKCAICGYSDLSDKNFFPVVDHDHVEGRIRGLLCMNCNMGIGKFKEDVSRLQSAISYLEGFNG